MSKEKTYSLHHILPKSRLGSNESDNLEMIRDTTHRSIHCLFQNQMFAEQLITMTNLNAKALREDVVEWLIDTLSSKDISNPYERYKDSVIKY